MEPYREELWQSLALDEFKAMVEHDLNRPGLHITGKRDNLFQDSCVNRRGHNDGPI